MFCVSPSSTKSMEHCTVFVVVVCLFLWFLFLSCFVSLIAWTQANVIWERGASVEKMPLSGWIVGKTKGVF